MSKNEIPEIQSLEPVNSLWEVWPNEAHDFTPWLVKHIDRLEATLGFNLKEVKREKTLSGAGRVDVYARQDETDVIVVIENQLGRSDDSHCLRLLGYAAHAADSGAEILVWVAKEFNPYHKSILEWLNKADTIDVYAVVVRAYRVGEALVADFQTVVDPSQSRQKRNGRKSASSPYAEFYRPLVERLRREGIRPSAWRGRYRSFHTGLPGVAYATRAQDKMIQVFLSLPPESFRALKEKQEEIDGRLKGIVWTEENKWFRIILENKGQFSLTGSKEEWGATREWMAKNLSLLRDVLQPYLDELKGLEEEATDDEG